MKWNVALRWPWERETVKPVKPPKVGGTRVPDNVLRIDFSKPHDFYFSGYEAEAKMTFKRCLLIGFTSPMENAPPSFEEFGQDRWLVLRQTDGRLVYVPRDGLSYIEESAPEG